MSPRSANLAIEGTLVGRRPLRIAGEEPGQLKPDDIIPDARLDLLSTSESSQDLLNHRPIASRIAELLLGSKQNTNVALFGPWGSGKSSFYGLLKDETERLSPKTKIVRYDAWKANGESLQTNFLASITDQVADSNSKYKRDLSRSRKTVELNPLEALKRNSSMLVGSLVLTAFIWFVISFGAALPDGLSDDQDYWSVFFDELRLWLPRIFPIWFGMMALLKLTDLATITVEEAAPSRSEEFADLFKELIRERVQRPPLIIFVDELDRCPPKQVVETLAALRTFLEIDGCVFVVAVDREAIVDALDLAPDQPKSVRPESPQYSTAGAYLDKIFQHQISLPPKRQSSLREFATALVVRRGGVWGELRQQPDNLFDRVAYVLVPAHVRSPRRVKVIFNTFALFVRTLEGLGLPWINRAEQIAFLVTLQTEFPHFASDLVREPRLIEMVVGHPTSEQHMSNPTVQRYVSTDKESQEGKESRIPAAMGGPESLIDGVIEGVTDIPASVQSATRELNSQLIRYLNRTISMGVSHPTPDLIYLESRDDSRLASPDLENHIEMAGDSDPEEVASAFDEASDEDRLTAIKRLTDKSNEEGPVASNALLTSACMIAGRCTPRTLLTIGHGPAANVLAGASHFKFTGNAAIGALSLAAVAGNTELETVALDYITEKPLDDLSNTDPIAILLDRMSADGQLRIINWLIAEHASDEHRLPTFFTKVPVKTLDECLKRVPVASMKDQFHAPKPESEESAAGLPPLARQEMAERNKVKAAEWADSQEERANRYNRLIESAKEDDMPAAAIRWLLAVGIEAGVNRSVANTLEDRFESFIHRLSPETVNDLALNYLLLSPAEPIKWLNFLSPDHITKPELPLSVISRAAKRLEDQDLDGERLDDELTIIIRLSDVVTGSGADSSVAQELATIADRLTQEWSEEPDKEELEHHRRISKALSALIPADKAKRALSLDLVSGANLINAPEVAQRLIEWLRDLSIEEIESTAVLLEETVDDGDLPSLGTLALKLTILSQLSGAGVQTDVNIPSSVMSRVDIGDLTGTFVELWVLGGVPWRDLDEVLKIRDLKLTAPLAQSFVNASTIEDRDQAWLECGQRGLPREVLGILASKGITSSSVEEVADRVHKASNNTRRMRAARLMTTLPPHERNVNLAAYVVVALEKAGRAVDLPIAYELLLRFGKELPKNARLSVLSSLTRWTSQHPTALAKEKLRVLQNMGLIDKSKPWLETLTDNLRGHGPK